MKSLLSLLLAATLLLTTAACGSKPAPEVSPEPEIESQQPEEPETQQPDIPDEPEDAILWNISDDVPEVMDGARYRGVVLSSEKVADGVIFELEQYTGTNFGAKTLRVKVTADTRLNVLPEDVLAGNYLEVAYGGSIPTDDTPVDAITLILLGDPASRVYNGTIEEITFSEEDQSGSMTMVDMNGENQTVFHFNDNGETQFYMNKDDLKVGAQLSIFHNPAVTASMPPQTFAVEVTPYHA